MTEHLGDPRVQRFLSSQRIIILATLQADGAPLAMPLWFVHDATGVTMISLAEKQKVRNLSRDPRACVVAQALAPTGIQGVIVRGRVEFLEESPERRGLVRAYTDKYRPDVQQLWGGDVMPPGRAVFRLQPEAVRSWGLLP